jgi:hypothetical protein
MSMTSSERCARTLEKRFWVLCSVIDAALRSKIKLNAGERREQQKALTAAAAPFTINLQIAARSMKL